MGTSSITQGTMEAPMNTSNPSATNYPNGGADYMELTAPLDANYTILVNYTNSNSGGSGASNLAYIITYVNGSAVNTFSTYTGTTTNYSYTANNLKKGDTIKVKIWSGRNNSNYYNKLTANSGSISRPNILYKEGLPGKPKEIDTLGNKGYITIYGKHTDNIYYGGIMTEKDITATTGSITLGNAQGYIRVLFNGEYIKIPYYGD